VPRVSLGDRLAKLVEPGTNAPQVRTAAPSGWEPGVRFEPNGDRVVTLPPSPALADEESWAEAVRSLGADVPDGYRVRLVEAKYDASAWQRDEQGEDAVTRPVWRYRFVVEVAPAKIDVDELLRTARPRKAKRPAASSSTSAFVYAAGDMQIAKPDGDGTAGTVERWYDSLERAVDRYKTLRKQGKVGPVFLLIAGDCIEGVTSQGGNLIARLELTITEQVRVYRRLLLDEVQAFAELCDDVTVAVVPGNHDEAVRVGNQMATRYDDSWAIEGASQVADVMAAKGQEVNWIFPDRDGLHLTLDAAGTRVGLLHGHQTRGKMQTWLANKAMSRDPIGTADLVISGHFHHLRVEQMGPTTWMQTGALDGGSTWWSHKGGLDAPPAALTLIASDGQWNGLEIV
jgi:predicted phosphodiesterase